MPQPIDSAADGQADAHALPQPSVAAAPSHWRARDPHRRPRPALVGHRRAARRGAAHLPPATGSGGDAPGVPAHRWAARGGAARPHPTHPAVPRGQRWHGARAQHCVSARPRSHARVAGPAREMTHRQRPEHASARRSYPSQKTRRARPLARRPSAEVVAEESQVVQPRDRAQHVVRRLVTYHGVTDQNRPARTPGA